VWRWFVGFWAIAQKEIAHFRNRKYLKAMVISQCLDFAVMAWIDITARELPTVIVDQDHTSESRELIERVAATKTFDIKYATSSTEQARGHIRAGRAKVAVVIPSDYGRMRAGRGTAQILAIIDGSDGATSAQAAASIQGVAGRMNLEAQQESVNATPQLTPHAVLLFNPQGSMSSFMLPGLLAIILSNFYMAMAAASLTSERDGGNLERLLMTSMNHSALILGKLAPWLLIGVLNAASYILVTHFGLGVPIRGSLVLLVVTVMLYVLTTVSLGSFVAAGAPNGRVAGASLFYIGFPALWFSGYIFPIASLPVVLRPISYALPHTHFIEMMRGICLRGADASELAPHLIYLIVAPILLMIGSVWRFSKSIMQ
jgi:ABC-2 type transport system permease protein